MVKIYNTLERQKVEFQPIVPHRVQMYVCGPTVYNYIHIGNARPAIFFDVVRRYLESQGYQVHYVSNFTDIDDKILRKAEEMHISAKQVAETFIEAFLEDIHALGVKQADINPKVTDNIPEIIVFIEQLMAKGYAYAKEGDVFFRTSKFAEYGKLSHQDLNELQYGIRIEVDERKENPQDFVLWKKAKPGEVYWDSPWGAGRPGWHIECSAMVHKYLGSTIDIHGGGQDLAFPHHECEIAQSEANTGHVMANIWMHNAFVNMDNEKMSKSLGNTILIRDILKSISAYTFRFFMLSTHYRNPLNYSQESLTQAEHARERIQNCFDHVSYRLHTATDLGISESFASKLDRIRLNFEAKMNDDFNTPDAISAIFELVNTANMYLQQQVTSTSELSLIVDQFIAFDQVLGIIKPQDQDDITQAIEQLIEERNEARRLKKWARADELRDELMEMGILLEDTPQGIKWRRK
jgi:cysteinyl-tRNA synthetase